ncbi:hypothetical protein Q8F55_001403 [Vanrija albida]|uniref:Uncharacterized protein n=1 Tax=Vanrija albida TaxID=181172 RepID=A0ABR3QFY5_9TREE
MAEQDLQLLDDNPSATPLDLLLNAITGRDTYHFAEEGGGEERGEQLPIYIDPSLEGAAELDPSSGRKRALESPQLGRAAKAPRLTPFARGPGAAPTLSTVEVWHPKTGQKSYGKERRIIQPPPTLRVLGPLLPHLTSVTLAAHPNTEADAPSFSSQTHRVGLAGERELAPAASFYTGGSGKKAERDDKRRVMRQAAAKTGWGGTLPWERSREDIKARDEVAEGLTFPGLWVGEDPSKSKEFRLELTIGDPVVNGETQAVEAAVLAEPATIAEAATQELDTAAPLDADSLHQVLGDTVIAAMGDIPDTVEESGPLVDHLQQAASLATLEETQQTLASATAEPESEPKTQETAKPWATFVSDPLTLVSKPSQKTAKARSMASCLSTTDAFALWVRVNAQTVRTKYMKLDGGDSEVPELAARAGRWSPFRFEVLRRAAPPETEDKNARARFKLDLDREAGVVTYGSIVQLVDVHSGVRSGPMLLVRVDKNEAIVGGDHGHPVSELQRVGLVRVLDNYDVDLEGGSRWYLSAPGALAGAGEVKVTRQRGAKGEGSQSQPPAAESSTSQAVPETLSSLEMLASDATAVSQEQSPSEPQKRKKKTKRHALAKAAIDEEEQGSTQASLTWNASKRREGEQVVTEGKVTTSNAVTIETVDDFMCWVLGGVSCFSYSFFNGFGDDGAGLPTGPLGPVPRLLVDPAFHPEPNTLDLTLSHFFVPDEAGGATQPFSVYLGPIGPLSFSTWRSVAPKDKYYDPATVYPAIHYDGSVGDPQQSGAADGQRVYSNFPYSVPHVIANVVLPDPEEVVRVTQEYAGAAQPVDAIAPATDQVEAETTEVPDTATAVAADDNSWLGVMGPAGELTIQEALRNAGKSDLGLGGSTDATQPADAPVDATSFELEHLPSDLIPPSLDLAEANGNDHATVEAPAGGAQLASATPPSASTTAVVLSRPEPAARDSSSLQHLPVLLVRPDGVGHGIGWSVVVQRAPNSQQQPATPGGGAPWGLRVVKTSSTNGQSAGW